jgi:phosphoglycerate dehydrogenase-like enzyme
MKPGSYLMSLARGGVVNEKALLEELAEGDRLRGVGLDVHENEGEGKISPFASLPNVVLTPHVGAQTLDSQREIGDRVLESVKQFETKLNQQESISSTVSK